MLKIEQIKKAMHFLYAISNLIENMVTFYFLLIFIHNYLIGDKSDHELQV